MLFAEHLFIATPQLRLTGSAQVITPGGCSRWRGCAQGKRCLLWSCGERLMSARHSMWGRLQNPLQRRLLSPPHQPEPVGAARCVSLLVTHARDDARRDTAQRNSQTNARGIGLCTDAAAGGLSRGTRRIPLPFFSHCGRIVLQYIEKKN